MKYIFRIIILLLLITLIAVILTKNKKTAKFEVDQAQTVIDSIPVSIFDLKLNAAGYSIETVGKVKSANEVYVVSQTPGEIKQIFVKIGQQVGAGDVIAHIDDFYARQEYDMAKKAAEQFQKDYDRYANLAGVDAITQQQLELLRLQLEGAQTKMNSLGKRLNDYVIKAPLAGSINQLFVSKGNATGLGTPVCEIIGGFPERIEAKINPEQAKYLRVGLKATLSGEFGHAEKYHVQLSEIGERAGKFGGVAAIFTFAPDERKLPKTGSIVNIRIDIPVQSKLLVPRKAIISKNGEMGFFVLKEDSKVEFVQANYLDFDDEQVVLIGNELNNRTIVVEGAYLLKAGDVVKVVK